MYLDTNGLLVQSSMDGGDSAQRMGMWYAAVKIRERLGIEPYSVKETKDMADFNTTCKLLVTPAGLVRNPIGYNTPKDTSRDQTRPMVIAAGLYGRSDIVQSLKPRWGIFYPNYDLCSPENRNEFARALGNKPTWLGDEWNAHSLPLLCSHVKSNPDDTGDLLNTLTTVCFFNVVSPTETSNDAMRYLLKNFPPNDGSTKLLEQDNIIAGLKWYHRGPGVFRAPGEAGGSIECAEIWEDIVTHFRQIFKV